MNDEKRRLESGFVLGTVMLLVVCSLGVIGAPARAAIVPEWTAADDMGDFRTQTVVVNDEDGLVYVMGGVASISGGGYDDEVPNASSYDPDSGIWTDLTPMDTGVRGAAGVMGQDGRVYVIGGWNNTAGGPVDLTQIYDPDTDTWSTGTPIPVGSWECKAVAVYDDTIVVAGGEGMAGAVYRYDISDDSWNLGSTMPAAMHAGVFVSSGYYSFYIGGSDDSYNPTSTVFLYYPWDSWQVMTDMPAAMVAHAGVYAADGMIYVFGGGTGDSNIETGQTTGYCYDLSSSNWDVWIPLPDLLVAAKYLGAAATPDGRVLAIGGNSGTEMLNDVESLRVVSVTTTLSSPSVNPGDSILVTVSMEFAYAVPYGYELTTYLTDAGGVAYDYRDISSWIPNSFAFEVNVPEMALPGAYEVVIVDLVAQYSGGSSSGFDLSLAVTVVDSYSIDEQLTMLEANVSALQMAIIQAMVEANASTMAYLQTQLTTLQAVLAQIGAGLTTMGAAQTAAMDELNATLADLQLQLDDFQEQIDRVENKADTAGTYGMVTMVLVIIIVVLLALMMVMARKKP